jgi:hypothetical protein
MLPISKEVLGDEIALAQKVLAKWQQRLEQGVPGMDFPATDEVAAELFVRELVGEFLMLAGKLESIGNVIAGAISQ